MAPTLMMVELLISKNWVSNYAEKSDKTNYVNNFAIKWFDFDYGWITLLATF